MSNTYLKKIALAYGRWLRASQALRRRLGLPYPLCLDCRNGRHEEKAPTVWAKTPSASQCWCPCHWGLKVQNEEGGERNE
jgi:hypothetical protein